MADATDNGDRTPDNTEKAGSGSALPAAGALAGQKAAEQKPDESTRERFLFSPPIDIFETDEGLVLHADLPGVSIKTLELQVQDNKLTLFGRVHPVIPPEARTVHQEYGIGDFLRSFILSDEVDHERITATMTNGVLKVVLPKAPQAKPRRIEVNAEPTP
jgi:HSP20 family molecular chaperone IbpA